MYEKTLKDVRTQMDMLGRIFPGTLNARRYLHVENIIMLKDRPFSGELKIKRSFGYAMELDALPLDLLALKCEVCRWKAMLLDLLKR